MTAPDAVPAGAQTRHLLRAAAMFTIQLDELTAQNPRPAPLFNVEVRWSGGEPYGHLQIDAGETEFVGWCEQLRITAGRSIGQGTVVGNGRLGGLPVHLLGAVSGRVYDELDAEWPVRRLRELAGGAR